MHCGLTDPSLPKGLVRLHRLIVPGNPLIKLKLSEDLGKHAAAGDYYWPIAENELWFSESCAIVYTL